MQTTSDSTSAAGTTDPAAQLTLLRTAADAAATVVERFDPAALDRPNPTATWDTRTLTNHFIVWTAYALEQRGRRQPLDDALTTHDFVADPGWQADYLAHLRTALHVWAQPGAFDGEIDTGHASMPARDIATMLLLELVLHGWDVASASGQDYRSYLDPTGFGEPLLALVQQWAPMYRRYDGFAAEVDPPAGATPLDRALALSGRDPNWARTTA